ncbi:signal peptidase I [Bacillus cereus]|uniref:Signal peptidase I n=1 Tax=Bacillus cereus TaxID=1396 RepID=A0A9X7CH18_BACCE|nr:signal peptidase I [Bacillus cereus]PGS63650.1 signal peptidase I [Bacillus cereus]
MKIWQIIKKYGISFLFCLFLVFSFNVFVFQTYIVQGHSMDPTLQDQEYIYTSKLGHTFSSLPQYNDIVVIDSRIERKRTFLDDIQNNNFIQLFLRTPEDYIFVKRVIGKPGDTLEIKDNSIYRNGEKLNESYIKEIMKTPFKQIWIVPQHYVFVMGDNRNNSKDSRVFGPISLDHVLGKVISGWGFNHY